MFNTKYICLFILIIIAIITSIFYLKSPIYYQQILLQYQQIIINQLQSNVYVESFLLENQHILHDGSDCTYYDDKNGLFHRTTKYPRFIVTGGAGLIGSHLVKRLRQQYDATQIKVLDNLSHGRLHNLQYEDGTWAISTTRDFCLVDLRNHHIALKYMRGADVCFHLANSFSTTNHSSAFYETILMKINVLYATKLNKISKIILGETISSIKLNSSSSSNEKIIQYQNDLLLRSPDFNIGTVRFQNVYGPYCDFTDVNEQVMGWLIEKVLNSVNGHLPTWKLKEEYHDFIYVDDAVDSLMLTYEQKKNKKRVFDIKSGRTTSLTELIQMISNIAKEKLGRKFESEYNYTPDEIIGEQNDDKSHVHRNLKWRAKVKLEEGIWRTMSWISKNQKKPRVLVTIFGQARGGRLAWNSLHKFLLHPFNAHLAWYTTHLETSSYLHDRVQYLWMEPNHDAWDFVYEMIANTCNNNNNIVGKWKNYCKLSGLFMGGIETCKQNSRTAVLFSLRWLLQQKINKLQLLEKYDWFIITRADELHLCDHYDFINMIRDDIQLPTDEHYNGWSDRHLITRSSMFMKMINITTELVCNPDYWFSRLEQVEYELNIELIQKLIWEKMKLTVSEFPRSMFTVRSKGDPTSWSQGEFHPELSSFDLTVKYPMEFESSRKHCQTMDLKKAIEPLRHYEWKIVK
ncbi:hypothetical protein I4U23_016842 [Adineta vaga]|nr:hypothetical protein I4U23_016842 [Adineta vaga]